MVTHLGDQTRVSIARQLLDLLAPGGTVLLGESESGEWLGPKLKPVTMHGVTAYQRP